MLLSSGQRHQCKGVLAPASPASIPEEHGTSHVPQGAYWEGVTKRWTGPGTGPGVQWKEAPEQRWDHSALKWTFEGTVLH